MCMVVPLELPSQVYLPLICSPTLNCYKYVYINVYVYIYANVAVSFHSVCIFSEVFHVTFAPLTIALLFLI